ncbi:MAG: AI-2E family transporter [Clostridiales bacterium]|nr:AI-2E family transporter [Clostridiales bacterium]
MLNWKSFFLDKQYIKFSAYFVVTILVIYILYSVLSHLNVIFSFVGIVLSEILGALTPLIYGLIIAYFFSPLVNIIDNKIICRFLNNASSKNYTLSRQIAKRKRTISIALSFILVIIIFALLLYTLYSMIMGKITVEKIDIVSSNIANYFLKYEELFANVNEELASSGLTERIRNPLNSFIDWFTKEGLIQKSENIAQWLASLGGNLFNIFLGMVIAFYLLKDQRFFMGLWDKAISFILPQKAESTLLNILRDIHMVISNFFRGQLLDGLIVGVLSSIGLFIIGIDFAIFIGMFAGIANVIPYFGPIIGIIPAVAMALLDGSIAKAILSVIVLLVIQQVDGAVIAPKIVGKRVGLHPVFVLLSVIIGGRYFGIIGMLLAVPTAAIIKLFILKIYYSKLGIDRD